MDEFKVGDEVIVYDGGLSEGPSRVSKILKFYINGNFILTDSKQQYNKDGKSTERGFRAGCVVPMTPELLEELVRGRLSRAILRKFNKFNPKDYTTVGLRTLLTALEETK